MDIIGRLEDIEVYSVTIDITGEGSRKISIGHYEWVCTCV